MIAFDAKSVFPVAFQGNVQWNHTPVGTPKGVLVLICQNKATSGSLNDEITGVTYGGVSVPEVSLSPFTHNHVFDGGVLHAFYLGENVPVGVQQVKVIVNSPVYSFKRVVAVTYTADGNTAVENVAGISQENLDDPAVTLTTSAETVLAGLLLSGHPTQIGVGPGTGFVELLEHDFGSQVASFIRSAASVSAGSPVVDWSTVGDDVAGAIAVAIKEV